MRYFQLKGSQSYKMLLIQENLEDPTAINHIEQVGNNEVQNDPIKKIRKPKKTHCCLYCNKLTVTLTRHLKTKHADEPAVKIAIHEAKEIMQKASHSLNRIAIKHSAFAKIRKEGDLKYNRQNTENKQIVVKSTYAKNSNTVALRENCVCLSCNGIYAVKNFRNHRNKYGECKRKENENRKNLIGVAKLASLNIPAIASPILKEKIYPHFTKPKQKEIIFYDPVLIAFGNALCMKYFQTNSSSQNYKQISSNLRLMADLLIEARKLDSEIKHFDDILYAHKRNIVTEAIRKRCHFSEDGFKSPSTALELCNLLSKVCNVMKGLARDESNYKLAERYNECDDNMKNQRNIYITRTARENRLAIQRRKLEILPTTAEIKELIYILQNNLSQDVTKFDAEINITNYKSLLKTILVYLMVFNRKRPVDIHNWRVDEYKEEQEIDEEELLSVPEVDRNNIRHLRRCVTRHKLNRNEAILIPPNVSDGLKLLLRYRDRFIRDSSNKYIFAHPSGKRSPIYRADECLRELCTKHHLDYTTLKSTKLRKHLATCTATLPRDTQQHLSKFMSHNEGVHYDIYQRRTTTDITVVGRILNHASGITPSGLNITTEINHSNRSIEDISDALWLSEDDLLDNETSHCDDEIEPEVPPSSSTPRSEMLLTNSETHHRKENSPLFPLDISLTKKKKIDFNLKKKSPNMVSNTWTFNQKQKICTIFAHYLEKKEAPSIGQIQNKLRSNNISIDKTYLQIQAWIRAEIKRRIRPSKDRNRWTEEEINSLRQQFTNYYKLTQQLECNTYPNTSEIEMVISSIPLLKNKNVQLIRSKLQHEFKQLLQKMKGQK